MKKMLFCLLSYCFGMPFFAPGQPIRTALLPPAAARQLTPATAAPTVAISMINDSLQKNYTNITLRWQLLVNGLVRQKGTVPGITLFPGRPRTARLPVKPPAAGEEAFIKVEYHIPPLSRLPIAVRILRLTNWGGDLRIPATGELTFADSNDLFTITSPNLRITFDKQTGWIQAYATANIPLLTDTTGLRPSLPAAAHLQLFSTSTGPQMAIVRTEYTVPELSCLLHLSYTLNSGGTMLVEQILETDTTRGDSLPHSFDSLPHPLNSLPHSFDSLPHTLNSLPHSFDSLPHRSDSLPYPLEKFGMNWRLPLQPDSVTWYGLSANAATDEIPSLFQAKWDAAGTGSNFVARSVRWFDIHFRDKGFQLTADSNFFTVVSGDPTIPLLSLFAQSHRNSPIPPLHLRLAFRLTPLAFPPRPTAKPI